MLVFPHQSQFVVKILWLFIVIILREFTVFEVFNTKEDVILKVRDSTQRGGGGGVGGI